MEEEKNKNKNDLSNKDDQEIEILKKEDKNKPAVVSKPSKWPWINKFNKKGIDSYTETIKSEENLMGALGSHSKTKSQLSDIDIEIETERIDRRIKLKDSQREAVLSSKKDELSQIDIDLDIAKKQKELSEIKKGTDINSEADLLKEKLEKDLEHEQIRDDYKRKKQILKSFGQLKTRKEILKFYDKEKENLLNGRSPDRLSPEEQEHFEDLESALQEALDRL